MPPLFVCSIVKIGKIPSFFTLGIYILLSDVINKVIVSVSILSYFLSTVCLCLCFLLRQKKTKKQEGGSSWDDCYCKLVLCKYNLILKKGGGESVERKQVKAFLPSATFQRPWNTEVNTIPTSIDYLSTGGGAFRFMLTHKQPGDWFAPVWSMPQRKGTGVSFSLRMDSLPGLVIGL